MIRFIYSSFIFGLNLQQPVPFNFLSPAGKCREITCSSYLPSTIYTRRVIHRAQSNNDRLPREIPRSILAYLRVTEEDPLRS